MTSRNLARHRKAARPLTPLSDATPALRRGLVVAASSGLALTMITSAANAAGGNTQSLERSAGALSVSPAAKAEALITQNAPIEVDADVAANADTPRFFEPLPILFQVPISLYNGSVIFGAIELPASKSPAGWEPPYGDRTTGRAGGPVLILRVMKWGLRAGDPFR